MKKFQITEEWIHRYKLEEKALKQWFEKELKKFDFPCWCYKSDLVNMFENIMAKMQGKKTAVDRLEKKGKFERR